MAATMVLTTNDPDEGEIEISLSGTAPLVGPDLVVAPSFDLSLSPTGVQNFEIPISNAGGMELSISAIQVTGADAPGVSITSFPPTLAVSTQGVVGISVDPSKMGPGAVDAALSISSNDAFDAVSIVVLNGGLPNSFYPVSAIASNTVDFFNLTNLIAGVGLGFGADYPHNAIEGGAAATTWVTSAPNGGAEDYFANGVVNPVIIFDLGEDVALGEINTWGYAAGNTNGAKNFTLRFATSAEGGNGGLGDENFGSSITYQPSFEAGFSPTLRDVHVFDQVVVARYVEMTITDNWRGLQEGLGGGDRVGLGEVAFPVYELPVSPVLEIVSAKRLVNGDFTVKFRSVPGVTYDLARSINGENWDRLLINEIAGEGPTTDLVDTNPLSSPGTVIYRVVQP